mmetsp:Transcript_18562/g.53285  ORF Transcript_18562/g.53285 Transcript_18562/m.53285 type:complete len:525 (+) Transcript_18562:85-1659(+)
MTRQMHCEARMSLGSRRRRSQPAPRIPLASALLLGLFGQAPFVSAFQHPTRRSCASRSPLFTAKIIANRVPYGYEDSRRLNSVALPFDDGNCLANDNNNIDSSANAPTDGTIDQQATVPVQPVQLQVRRREAKAYLKQKKARSRAKKILDSTAEAQMVVAHQALLSSENLDTMRARAGVLRRSIVRQQMELQDIERRMLCLERPAYPVAILTDLLAEDNPAKATLRHLGRSMNRLTTSTQVLMRKLYRVKEREGPRNRHWNSVSEFVDHQRKSGVRIVKGLVENPDRLRHLADPATPTLVAHVPAILARLDKLEDHVADILERVLNNSRHLHAIEPYLDEILDRFDDIEPHLSWILDNIDALAPYTGQLLRHIDSLLVFADTEEHEMSKGSRYDLAEQLLPHLETYVSQLDAVGPHLILLRPHVPLLLKHNRIAKISPYIDRLFARGYTDLSASANMDVLLYWFGWSLRIPGLPRLFFSLPWSPRIVSFLANRMPKRFVRGPCSGISCQVDNVYHDGWNKMSKA